MIVHEWQWRWFCFSFSLQNTFYTLQSQADHLFNLWIDFSAKNCNEVLPLEEPVKSYCSSCRSLNRFQRGKMLGFILRRRVRQHHFAWISHHCIRACSLWAAPVCFSWCKPSGSVLAALKEKRQRAKLLSQSRILFLVTRCERNEIQRCPWGQCDNELIRPRYTCIHGQRPYAPHDASQAAQYWPR